MVILFNMPYFFEEINGKNEDSRKKEEVNDDNSNCEEKEEDFRLPLTLGENYSALAAMT